MKKIIFFLKTHWFSALLLIALLFLVFQNRSYPRPYSYNKVGVSNDSLMMSEAGLGAPSTSLYRTSPPVADESVSLSPGQRMTTEDISTSLKVKDVDQSLKDIKEQAEKVGGFMVSSSFQSPSEASSGNIAIRIPRSEQEAFIEYLKENSIKVVSFNVSARDVTDEYQDTAERLRILEQNKQKLEQIMDSAETAEEMLRVQKSVFQVQQQIESLVGRQKYLEETSSTTRISIYVATDEYALPYVPDNNFRPEVIFKNAVRSLVNTIHGAAGLVIWVIVYSVVWVPLLIIGYFVWRKYIK